MSKIGFLYDTYDPIHIGHSFIAKMAVNSLGLDEVYTLLSDEGCEMLSFDTRYRMVEIGCKDSQYLKAYKGNENLRIEEFARSLDKEHEYYLIVDARSGFKKFNAKKLSKYMKIVTCGDEEYLKDIEHIYMEGDLMPCTCSYVAAGNFLYLDRNVLAYILENEYYLDAIVKGKMSEKRYNHSKSVQRVSVELAIANNLDPHKASLAGLLHDVMKQIPNEEMAKYMELESEEARSYPLPVHHQWAGARYVEHNLQIHDRDIIEAIRHHTTGGIDNPYVYILFIADKIEPTRGYDTTKEMELAKIDLKTAYDLVKKEQEEYIRKEK